MPGHYAVPVRSNKNVLMISIAALAGIGFGALVIYQWHTKQAPVFERTAATSPAPEPKVAPERPSPGPAKASGNSRKHPRTESADFTPPVLLTPPKSGATVVMKATAAPPVFAASPQTPGSQATATPMIERRAGVQDPGAGYEPMPLAAPQNSADSTVNAPPASAPALTQSAPQAAAQRTPSVAQSAYAGPTSGIATWTGKLGKNELLTIDGGTPSTGILAGAGLPGVPVKLTIDQANLGIVEMPSAANGYRRLVLRSHAKRDKIVIRWIANP